MPGVNHSLVQGRWIVLLLAAGLAFTALGCWLDRSIDDAATVGGAR